VEDDERHFTFGLRLIPDIEADRPKLRTTLTYRFAPTFSAGLELNPIVTELGPLANWVLLTETDARPAFALGTSSDRIGTPYGRAYYGTLSKDLEAWTGLPIAPYAGASYGTFDDEFVAIAGLSVRWTDRVGSMHMWDGHELHHLADYAIDDGQLLGVVLAAQDGRASLGVTFSFQF
jgi:hypothetical protein